MFFFWYSKKTEKAKPKKKTGEETSVGQFILAFVVLMAILAFFKYFKIILVLMVIAAAIIIIWWKLDTRKEEKENEAADSERDHGIRREPLSYTEPEIGKLSYLLEHEIKRAVNTKKPDELFETFEDVESIMKKVDALSLNEEEQKTADVMQARYDELIKNKQQMITGLIRWNLDDIARNHPDNKAQMNYEFVKKLQPYAEKIEEAGVEIVLKDLVNK